MNPMALLSLGARARAWSHHYPTRSFWQPWHLALLNHGGLGAPPPPVSIMADLYHPARPLKNPGSTLLLTFERRTLLGRLPTETRLERTVLRSLLDACADLTALDELATFWGDLPGHVAGHLTATEAPHLAAAARAVRAEVRRRGADPDAVPGFFPRAVTDAGSYAALARALLFVALLPASPLGCRLYCASNSRYVPHDALTLNIDVSEGFLQSHGEGGEREVVLGLSLALAEIVQDRHSRVFVPILHQQVFFGTLFAPSAPLSSRLRRAGQSATLYLQ